MDFRDIQRRCLFRVKDKDRAMTFWRLSEIAPEEHEQMFHFCIRRDAPGFLDSDGFDTLNGFGKSGDPCSEAFCPRVWAGSLVRGEEGL